MCLDKSKNIYSFRVDVFYFVPEARLELARIMHPRDFKSLVSTNSTTRARNISLEVAPGFEPG